MSEIEEEKIRCRKEVKKVETEKRSMQGKSGTLTPQLAKCPGCGEEFTSYDEFIDHVVMAHNATCQICGAHLTSKRELLEHNKEKHGVF